MSCGLLCPGCLGDGYVAVCCTDNTAHSRSNVAWCQGRHSLLHHSESWSTPGSRGNTTRLVNIFLGVTLWRETRAHVYFQFYPRDTMLAPVIAIATCPSVRLSVRLSVTRRYCVKTKKASGMISSPSGSPKTLVFWRQISSPNSKGFPRTGPQTRVSRKNSAIF